MPRRRSPKYFQKSPKRKTWSKKSKPPHLLNTEKNELGTLAESTLKYLNRHGNTVLPHDAALRFADYLTSKPGTTEDLVGERRALMDAWSPEEAEKTRVALNDVMKEISKNSWDSEVERLKDKELGIKFKHDSHFNESKEDPLQLAFGPWSDTIITVDRVQKVQRGGTIVSYRALVIGGNLNGCAGFGVGKASAPNEAAEAASRVAKRNIFFVDRYLGSGLTSTLEGKHNSCKVTLRSVNPNRGLHGHPLICEILKYFGITDSTAKSHGNRNVYNVVYATFKALMTHESLEHIALKRGKRLLNIERSKRLGI